MLRWGNSGGRITHMVETRFLCCNAIFNHLCLHDELQGSTDLKSCNDMSRGTGLAEEGAVTEPQAVSTS